MTKVILISQVPLPFSKIGSWTTLYKNYLQKEHQIDFIVCEPPETQFENVKYSLVANDLIFKIRRKIKKNRYLGYLEALDKILKPNEKYIIQIVDNFGIVKPLTSFFGCKRVAIQLLSSVFLSWFSSFL